MFSTFTTQGLQLHIEENKCGLEHGGSSFAREKYRRIHMTISLRVDSYSKIMFLGIRRSSMLLEFFYVGEFGSITVIWRRSCSNSCVEC